LIIFWFPLAGDIFGINDFRFAPIHHFDLPWSLTTFEKASRELFLQNLVRNELTLISFQSIALA